MCRDNDSLANLPRDGLGHFSGTPARQLFSRSPPPRPTASRAISKSHCCQVVTVAARITGGPPRFHNTALGGAEWDDGSELVSARAFLDKTSTSAAAWPTTGASQIRAAAGRGHRVRIRQAPRTRLAHAHAPRLRSVPVETGGKDAPAISRRELLEEYGCAGGDGLTTACRAAAGSRPLRSGLVRPAPVWASFPQRPRAPLAVGGPLRGGQQSVAWPGHAAPAARSPRDPPLPALSAGAGEPVWTSRERRHDFYRYEAEEEVHTTRRKRMLRKYPQIRELYKPDPIIAVQTLSVVAMQMVICWMMRDKAWWFVVLWCVRPLSSQACMPWLALSSTPGCRPRVSLPQWLLRGRIRQPEPLPGHPRAHPLHGVWHAAQVAQHARGVPGQHPRRRAHVHQLQEVPHGPPHGPGE